MTSKKEKTNEDNYLPTQYLNNENPYAFRQNYNSNLANLSYNKEKLNTLHRLQPQKLNIVFDQKSLDEERKYMIGEAIGKKRTALIEKAFAIIQKEPVFDKSCEKILEDYMDNEEILDILLELKRTNLIYHQMRLRARVSHVLSGKINENMRTETKSTDKVEVDNLKEALIYSSLNRFYTNTESESTSKHSE